MSSFYGVDSIENGICDYSDEHYYFFKLIDTKQTKLNFSSVIVTSIVSCAPLKKQHLWWFIFVRDPQIQEQSWTFL